MRCIPRQFWGLAHQSTVTRGLVKFDAWPAGIAPKPFTLLFKPGDELLEISLLTGPRLFLPFEFQMPPVDVRDCVGDLNQRRVHGLDGKGGELTM